MSDVPASLFVSAPRVAAPEISVLVPICNVERYLAECLDSLRAQTFSNFEVLCINDGSTDGSRDIIQRYLDLDERFRVIDKPNSGYGASMNIGLDNAQGIYIAILESDDFYEPNALEVLIDAAHANGSDVVKADFYLYWSKPEVRNEQFHIVDDREIGRTMNPLDDMAIFFRKPSIWSALYRIDFLRQNGIRFLETPGASYQDAGFNFKVWVAAERATFIGDAILHYRQDNEKSSVNSAAKVFCVCDEYASMEEYLVAREGNSQRYFAIMERMKFDSYMWNYDRLSPELRPRFVERASKEFEEDLEKGHIDFDLFEPGAEADLRLFMTDFQEFMARRDNRDPQGKIGALKSYVRLGGIPLVMKVFAFKFFKKSVRRINALGGAA